MCLEVTISITDHSPIDCQSNSVPLWASTDGVWAHFSKRSFFLVSPAFSFLKLFQTHYLLILVTHIVYLCPGLMSSGCVWLNHVRLSLAYANTGKEYKDGLPDSALTSSLLDLIARKSCSITWTLVYLFLLQEITFLHTSL